MILGVLVRGAWTLKKIKLQVMIRFLFCFFLSCVSLMPLQAQEKVKALRFNHVDGSIYVSLQNELTCDFATEDEISISADGKVLLRLKLSDMSGFSTVEVSADKTTGIVALPSVKDVLVETTSEGLTVRGLNVAEQVMIYNVGGTLVTTQKVDDNGKIEIKTSQMAKGVYIVKIGKRKTIKIQKS